MTKPHSRGVKISVTLMVLAFAVVLPRQQFTTHYVALDFWKSSAIFAAADGFIQIFVLLILGFTIILLLPTSFLGQNQSPSHMVSQFVIFYLNSFAHELTESILDHMVHDRYFSHFSFIFRLLAHWAAVQAGVL